MPKFQLDLSFSRDGTVQLHVFDLDSSDGPIDSCSVGEDLDSRELREAWGQFHNE